MMVVKQRQHEMEKKKRKGGRKEIRSTTKSKYESHFNHLFMFTCYLL